MDRRTFLKTSAATAAIGHLGPNEVAGQATPEMIASAPPDPRALIMDAMGELRTIYEALGVPAEVVQADEPMIIVRMRGEQGAFEVRSGSSLFDYYAARSGSNIN